MTTTGRFLEAKLVWTSHQKFMREFIVFCSMCTICSLKKVHVRYLICCHERPQAWAREGAGAPPPPLEML